ncbi:MAG: protein kinase [Chloroflexota bacterium]|nr:protein kinase [Chloroflexota bacterium]
MTVEKGKLLAQHYYVLGAAGPARFEAKDVDSGRLVLLTEVDEIAEQGTKSSSATIPLDLDHPGVVPVLEWFDTEDARYTVSELVKGETLAEVLHRGRMPLDMLQRVAEQVSAALAYLHSRGVVHGSISPEVIVLRPDGRVMLTGLGGPAMPQSSQLYARPKRNDGAPEPKDDLFAFGAVLYQALTGVAGSGNGNGLSDPLLIAFSHYIRTPLPPSELWPRVPPAWDSFVTRLLSEGHGSFSSAADVHAAAESLPRVETEETAAHTERPAQSPLDVAHEFWSQADGADVPWEEHESRKRWLLPLLAAAVIIVAGAAIGLVALSAQRHTAAPIPSPTAVVVARVTGQVAIPLQNVIHFDWSTIPGATAYHIQVSAPGDASFNRPIADARTPAHTFSLSVHQSGVYRWRVQARSTGFWIPFGAPSTVRVSLPATQMAHPGPLDPTNGSVHHGHTIRFCWSGVSGASSYQLLLDNRAISSGTSCTRLVLKNGQYSWRVAAVFAHHQPHLGPYSPAAHFSINVAARRIPPTAVIAQAPVQQPAVTQPQPVVSQPQPAPAAPVYIPPVQTAPQPVAPAPAPAQAPPSSSSSSGTSTGQSSTQSKCIAFVNC